MILDAIVSGTKNQDHSCRLQYKQFIEGYTQESGQLMVSTKLVLYKSQWNSRVRMRLKSLRG